MQELQPLEHTRRVKISRNAGYGFAYVKVDSPLTHKKFLLLSMFLFFFSTALFQGWVPGFNPQHRVGLTVPI